ncbi:YadA-like family protein [Moraxella atlantae]|uniref:YadA-like family protein n=1 Tax=Faucicola atlantae TaxID=34059 RepID=UPI003750C21C
MNHIYKVIFCKATGVFVAVAEFARAHGKKGSGAVGQAGEVKASATSVKYFALTALSGAMMVVSGQAMAAGSFASGNGVAITPTNGAAANNGNIYTNIAIGGHATATGKQQAIAIGSGKTLGEGANATGDQSIAIGANTNATGASSIAIGGDDLDEASKVNLDRSVSRGGVNSGTVATSYEAYTGYRMVDPTNDATQYINTQAGTAAVAVGVQANASGALATAIGTSSKATVLGATAFGVGAHATLENSVALGSGSKTNTNATGVTSATVNGINYSGFAGGGDVTAGDQVSVGSTGYERQIKNVAPGAITAASTDAINGSQLYITNNVIGNVAKSTATNLGGGSKVGADGNLTAPTYNVVTPTGSNYKTANNVGDGLSNLNAYVNEGFKVQGNGTAQGTVTPTEAINFVNGTNTTATVSPEANGVTNVTFNVNTTTLTPNNTGTVTAGNTAGLANANDIANAINNAGFTLQAQGANGSLVKPGATVNLNSSSPSLLTVSKNAADNTVNFDLSQTAKDGIAKGNTSVQTITTRISNDNGTSKTEAQTINQDQQYADFIAGDNIRLEQATGGGIKISSTAAAGAPIHYYSVNDNGGNENNYNNDGATGRDSLAIGINALASGQGSTAIGGLTNQATAQNTTAVGENNIASGIFGTAIGGLNSAEAGATAIGNNNTGTQAYATAIGRLNQNTAAYAVAIGSENRATGTYSTAIGYKSQATANNAIAVGNNATAPAANTVVIGNNASVNVNTSNYYNQSVAIGNNAKVGSGQGGTYQAGTANTGGTAVGHDAQTSYAGAVALGSARARASNSIAIGAQGSYWAITEADGAFAVGNGATVSTAQSIGGQAIGRGAIVKGPGGQAYGQGANAYGISAIAIGGAHQLTFGPSIPTGVSAAQVGTAAGAADRGIAIGSTARVGSGANDSIALGSNTAVADGAISAIAIGNNAKATGTQSISIGTGNIVSGNNSGALGDPSLVAGSNSYSVGNNNVISAATDNGFIYGGQNNLGGTTTRDTNGVVTGSTITGNNAANRSVAIGFQNNVATNANINDSVAIGSKNTIDQSNTFVLGNNVTTTQANSVVLGNASADRAATTETQAEVNGITYGNFAGQGKEANGVVSVGGEGTERQIINVAAGQISATSTDAINGSQLYLTQQALGNVANSTKNIIGGNTQVNSDGTLTVSNIGGTGKDTIDEAIKASKTEVQAGTNIANIEKTTGANGQDIYTVNADGAKVTAGTGVNVEAGDKDSNNITNYTVNVKQADLATNPNGTVTNNNTGDTFATGDQVANAINNAGFNLQTNGDEASLVKNGDTVQLLDGQNIAITREGNNITVATTKDLIADSLTTGDSVVNNDGITINNGNNAQPVTLTKDGLNNGGNKITNVAAGTADTDAVNVSQLQTAQAKATTKLEDGTATTVSSTPNADGSTTYNVNVQTDGTTLTVNGDNQLTAVTTALNSDGKGNTNATNPNNLVKAGDIANAINNAGFNLQTNGDEASLVKNGDTVQLLDGQNIAITREGNNITVATTKDLVADSLTTGNTVVNNDGVTLTGGNNQPVTLTNNGLNNGGNKITNVAAGTADTDAVNVSQLQTAQAKATTKLEDGTATTVSSTPNADGSTTYKVNAQTDGTTLTVNDNNQLTAQTSGIRAGDNGRVNINEGDNPDSLVTAGNVTNAINNAGFNLQTNGDTASLVKNGDTVQLLDGQNIAITRDGNNITVATTKDLVADSLTTGNTVVNNDGVTLTGGNNQPVTLTNNGLNNGGNKITNVAAGTADTDAVNVSQLQTAQAKATTKLEDGTATTVSSTPNADGSTTYNVNVQTDGTTLTVNGDNQLTAVTTALNSDGKGNTNATNPNNLVKAGDIANAINNAGFNLQTNGDEASLVKNGDTVQLLDGQNIAITREGNNITVATTKDLIADSLTTGDENGGAYIDRNIIGVGDNSTGQATVLQPGAITVGGPNNGIRIEGDAGKINGLTNKTFDPNNIVSGQAATEDQLQQAAAAATTKLANGTATTVETTTNEDGSTTYKVNAQTDGTTLTVNGDNQLTAVTTALNSDGKGNTNATNPNNLVKAGDIANAINNAGFNLQTNGDEASLVKNGDTVQLLDGQNIAITREGNNITVATTKDLVADSLTTGDTVINNSGVALNNGNNAQPVTLTKDGLNNGGNKITNVAPGDISTDSTDAVNGSQLYTTNQNVANNADTIAKGFNISADNGNTDNVQLGETINYTSTDGNIVTTANNNQIDLGLAPVVTVGNTSPISIDGNNGTIGGLTNIDFDPNNIVSGQAATEDQLQQAAAAATTKLANGTATTVETTTNEDGSTTYKVNAQTDGTTLTVNDNNQLTAKTSGINAGNDGRVTTNEGDDPNSLVTAGNVANAINNAGFNLQTNGDEASLVKNGDTVQLLDGQNIAITREGNNITVATKPNVVFDSVKAGNTIINQDGINNGGKLITNVASGLQGKTLSQIKDEGSSSSQWSNAATIGDLTQVQTNVSNTQQIVGGVDIDGNVVDGDGSLLTVVNADNSTTPVTLTAAEALRTYDAVGAGTVETNSVLTAVKNINEQGTKYIHFNGGERSVGGQRGTNDEQSQANGSKSTAIGYKTDANGDAAVAIGNQVLANGQQAIAIGDRAQAVGSQSISIGTENIVTGKNSGAIGDPSIIDGDNSYSIGNNNRIGGTTQNAFILGNNVQLGADNDGNVTNNVSGAVALGNNTAVNVAGGVALGENSVASRAGLGNNVTTNSGTITQATSDTTSQVFALQQSSQADKDAIIATATNSVGAVSVGREGVNRQITNVAAGSLDSDAVNVAQLRAAAQAASQAATAASSKVAAGQNITVTSAPNTDGSTTYTVATTPNLVADSLTINNGDNPVTLNASGLNNGGNRITNVAKGVDGTDAVNVDQLNNAINSAASGARTEIKAGTNIANVVKTTGENAQNIYTINARGTSTTAGSDAVTVTSSDAANNVTNYAVDLSDATKVSLAKADSAVQNIQAGQNIAITRDGNNVTVATTPNLVADSLTTGDTVVNNAGLTINNGPSVTQRGVNAGDQKITNVAAGDINADSKDAVNGSQLYATNQNVTQVQGDVAKLNNGAAGVVRYSSADTPTTPNGGVVSNDVTLVGKANEPVTIHNVAPGRAVTDAVNVGQLSALEGKVNNAVNKLGYRIDDVHDQANAGISAAMATAALPQAFLPGKSMVSGGLASYNGEGAVAVGVSTLSDNGRWVIKLSGTADTQGNAGGSIGAGFHW